MSTTHINKLKSYCLDLMFYDPSINEKEDVMKYANEILTEWSVDKLKSYAVCESINILEYQPLIEKVSLSLPEQFDMNVELQENIINEGVGRTILGIAIFGLIPWGIWRMIKHDHDVYSAKCRTFGVGKSYDECMLDAKIKYQEGLLKVIVKNMADKKCNEKCKIKSKKVIEKLKKKIAKNKQRLLKIRQKIAK